MISQLLINVIIAFALSLCITITYYYVNKKNLQNEMILTLLLLPVVVCTIIYTIGTNIAGAFSLAGIFTIVRFRSTQASPKDITYILIGVAAGLTCSVSMYLEGLILVLFCMAVIIVYEKINNKQNIQVIKVLISEDLINDDAIESVLKKYTKYFTLMTMQTKDLGSLFELVYQVNLSYEIDIKELINELRIINGNLTIKITKNKE